MTDFIFLQTNPIELLAIIFGFILVFVFIAIVTSVRRTKKYRQEVGDLYVAGKIRQIADNDKVDLLEELEKFKAWVKKNKVSERINNYDDAIEEELKERVEDDINTKPKK